MIATSKLLNFVPQALQTSWRPPEPIRFEWNQMESNGTKRNQNGTKWNQMEPKRNQMEPNAIGHKSLGLQVATATAHVRF